MVISEKCKICSHTKIVILISYSPSAKWQNCTVSIKTTPHSSAFRRCFVFTSSLLVDLKRAGLLMKRWGCRLGDGQSYCRMLNVTTRRQSIAWWNSPPSCWCVLVAALPRRLSTHQSSWASAGVYFILPAWRPRCTIQRVQIWRVSVNLGEFAAACSASAWCSKRWEVGVVFVEIA